MGCMLRTWTWAWFTGTCRRDQVGGHRIVGFGGFGRGLCSPPIIALVFGRGSGSWETETGRERRRPIAGPAQRAGAGIVAASASPSFESGWALVWREGEEGCKLVQLKLWWREMFKFHTNFEQYICAVPVPLRVYAPFLCGSVTSARDLS